MLKRSKKMTIYEKSMDFAVRIVKLYKYLTKEKQEYVISKQVLRSGTSIGANAAEAKQSKSKKEFIAKMSISLSEASETEFWLELLYKTGYLSEGGYESIVNDCKELEKILTAILKTSRNNEKQKVDS